MKIVFAGSGIACGSVAFAPGMPQAGAYAGK